MRKLNWYISFDMLVRYLMKLGFKIEALSIAMPEVFKKYNQNDVASNGDDDMDVISVDDEVVRQIDEASFEISFKCLTDLLFTSLRKL